MADSALDIVNAALVRVGEKVITSGDFATPPAAHVAAVVAELEYAPTRDEELRLHPWIFALVRATILAYTTPAATLTPGAGATVLGTTGVTFTAGSAVFAAGDVGKTLENQAAAGKALITGFSSTTVVTATITEAFPSIAAIASGSWRLYYAAPANTWLRKIPVPSGLLRLWHVRHEVPYRAEGAFYVTDADSLDIVYVTRITDTTLFDPAFDEALKCRLAIKFSNAIAGKQSYLESNTALYAAALQRAREANALEDGIGKYEENAADDTQSTIVSDAIARLLAQPVQGPVDPIDLTVQANRLYPNARDEMQRMHPWRFTRTRVHLDATTTVTLTPGAVTGDAITFTAGGAVFTEADVGLRIIGDEGGVARIVTFTSTTVVVANIEFDFDSITPIAAGSWHLAPPWRWTYRYAKPTGFLRLLETQEPEGPSTSWTGDSLQPTQEPAVLEGDHIVSDAGPTLNIEYIKRVTDPALFEPAFSSCLAALLAWRMALPLTKNAQIEQVMARAFAAQLKAVRTADKLDTTVPPIRYAPLTIVRR